MSNANADNTTNSKRSQGPSTIGTYVSSLIHCAVPTEASTPAEVRAWLESFRDGEFNRDDLHVSGASLLGGSETELGTALGNVFLGSSLYKLLHPHATKKTEGNKAPYTATDYWPTIDTNY